MPRIKITGYIDADETPEVVDAQHKSGLTAEGYDQIAGISFEGPLAGLKVSDLEDLETEYES